MASGSLFPALRMTVQTVVGNTTQV